MESSLRRFSLPGLLGIAHGASDAVAGFLVMQALMLNVEGGGLLILLYNGLAFGLQPVAGFALDRFNSPRRGAALALLLSAVGLIITWFDLRIGIICAGIGSAFFHAGAGGTAITSTPKRATGPGLFAAFGVVGLAIGSQLAFYFSTVTILGFVIVLTVLAALIWFYQVDQPQAELGSAMTASGVEIFIVAIVIAVALRSFVWVTAKSGIDDYTQPALWLALSAGLGKLLGGIFADRFGWRRWMVAALVLSMPFLAFKENGFLLLLLGVFFLQSVTPLSIAAVGQMLPSSPALAASLVLGLGVILGGVPTVLFQITELTGLVIFVPVLLLSIILYWFPLSKKL